MATKGLRILFGLMILSFVIAGLWNKVPIIKQTAHAVLDPTFGSLLKWNVTIGIILITLIMNLLVTIVNYYTMDKETMREIKKEQELLKEEMKKFKDNPEKLMELQKKQFAFFPKTLEVTMRPAIYTFIPLILLIRWFSDFFIQNPVKIFGFLSWFWAYLIMSIIFSSILRKLFKLP